MNFHVYPSPLHLFYFLLRPQNKNLFRMFKNSCHDKLGSFDAFYVESEKRVACRCLFLFLCAFVAFEPFLWCFEVGDENSSWTKRQKGHAGSYGDLNGKS